MPAAASDARPEILALESQAAANSLVEACLGRASRLQVIDTFPLLLAAGARSTRFVIRHDEAIVAHAASRDLTIATVGSGALRLANIGGVCTLPQVRGRGLASELVSALVDDARRRGLDGAILWSDRPSFYARMGFVDAGEERAIQVTPESLAPVWPAPSRRARPADLLRILELARLGRPFVERSFAEARQLLDLPDAMTLVTPAEGPIEAALCLGKGLDYQGMVSDWCGDPTRLPGLLKRVMDHLGLAATVIFAATRNEAFRRALQPHASAEVLTPLAMVKSFGEVDVATLFDEQGIHVPGLDAS